MLDCKAIGTPSKDIIGPKTGQVSAQPGTKTGHLQPKPGIKIRQVSAKPGTRIDHLSPNSVKKPPFMFSQRPYWPQNRPPSAQTWYENRPGFSPTWYQNRPPSAQTGIRTRQVSAKPGTKIDHLRPVPVSRSTVHTKRPALAVRNAKPPGQAG